MTAPIDLHPQVMAAFERAGSSRHRWSKIVRELDRILALG